MSSIEEINSKIDELFNNVRRYRKSSEFKDLLRFVSRFKTLSPYNSMLAHIQRPESRFLLRSSEWEKKYNRGIKEDAIPVIILVPFGPVDFLFEVGDTYPLSPRLDGKDDILNYLAQPYDTNGKISNDLYHNLLQNLAYNAILYTNIRVAADYAGKISVSQQRVSLTINIGNKKEPVYSNYYSRFTLGVNESANKEAKFSTICHELGHLLCRHIPSPDGWWTQRGLDKITQEFEAEVVAFIVCNHFGIDSNSEKYIETYLQHRDGIPNNASVETMWKAANDIIKMVESVSLDNGLIFKCDKDFKKSVKEQRAELKNKKKEAKNTVPSKGEKLPELPFKP